MTFDRLVRRYGELYRPAPDLLAFLDDQVTSFAGSSLPTVFQHGDPGTWNVISGPGGVVLLDWENGETRGVPLWDVFFFIHAVTLRAAARDGHRPTPEQLARRLFRPGRWRAWLGQQALAGARDLEIPERLLAPLFHLSWVYQAVKEAPRLRPSEVGRGVSTRIVHLSREAAIAGQLPFGQT